MSFPTFLLILITIYACDVRNDIHDIEKHMKAYNEFHGIYDNSPVDETNDQSAI